MTSPSLGNRPPDWDRIAGCVIGVWLALVAVVALRWHPIPLYTVESDVIGTYIPAARELAQGHIRAELYQSKGFGYPLLLAGAARLTGGDYFLAAKVVNFADGLPGAHRPDLLFHGVLSASG